MRVPADVSALYADGQALTVDRTAGMAAAQVSTVPAQHAIVAVGSVPELREGKVIDMGWCVPGQSERRPTRFVVSNRAAGWMVHNGASVWLAGRLPAGRPLHGSREPSRNGRPPGSGQGVISERCRGLAVAVDETGSPQFRFGSAGGMGRTARTAGVRVEVRPGVSAGDYHAPRLLSGAWVIQ